MRSGGSASRPCPSGFQPSSSPLKYGLPASSVASVHVSGVSPPVESTPSSLDEPSSSSSPESEGPPSVGPSSVGPPSVGPSSSPLVAGPSSSPPSPSSSSG